MKTTIRGKLLINGVDQTAIEEPVILIESNKIVSVGPSSKVEVDPDAKVIDLSDKVLLPGLMDAHIHLCGWKSMQDRTEWIFTPPPLAALRTAADARRLLEAGFTAVQPLLGETGRYTAISTPRGENFWWRLVEDHFDD